MGGAIGVDLWMRSVFIATGAMTLIGVSGNWLCQRSVHEDKAKNSTVISSAEII
jgi:hypothetical protein